MSTSIEFRNVTPLHVQIYWRDPDGQEHAYAQLLPYSSYTQQTYTTHEWIVRDRNSNQIIAQTTAQETPSVFAIDAQVRSTAWETPVTVHFKNETPVAVTLYWIDYAGEEQPYASLRPGDSVAQGTAVTHPWRVRANNSGRAIDLYLPTTATEQTHTIRLASQESLTPSTVTIRNDSPLAVQLEWCDFVGEPQPYLILSPNEEYTQATFASHPWLLRDLHSGLVVDLFMGTFDDQRVTFTAEALRSPGGVKETNLIFQNRLPFAIDLCWVNFGGADQLYATLQPGDIYTVKSGAGHPWRARHHETQALVGLFIPNGDPEQRHAFVATTYTGHTPATMTTRNNTHLSVDLFLVGDDGNAYKLCHLAPREQAALRLYEGARILVRDTYSGHLIRQATVDAGENLFTVTGLEAVSEGGTPSVNVRFTNQTPFPVKIFWVDFAGKEREYATLQPGMSYTQDTGARHVWRIREQYSNHIVGLFIANEEAEQVANYQVRSYHARTPTGISIENDSMLTVDVLWLDYNGNEQLYKQLQPGGSVGYQTYVTHPWLIRDSQSRRILDWNWGDQENQHILINDRDIKPRESGQAVNLTFTNRLPFTVDLFWLNYDGAETLYATLAAGQSYRQSTFESHPWRVRQQHSGDEIALYIANADAEQQVDIALQSLNSDVATTIDFVNLSPLRVGVYWIDYKGNEVHYATIDSRESTTLNTYMTHPWIVRDMNSGETVGFTVGVRQAQEFRITGATTRSLANAQAVNLNLTNNTGYTVDLNWVNFEGAEVTYATLAPGQQFQVQTGERHTWRIREKQSQAELDLYIANAEASQQHTIHNHLVRTQERKNALLWEGEVALYERDNYQGRVWILHSDTPNFVAIDALNDRVNSLRFGPDTAAALFQHVDYQGINDVFHLDTPSLADSDVGNDNISSIHIFTTPAAEQATIRSTSRLTDEYFPGAAGIESKSVMRTIITVPPLTGAVDVWATEETTIQVGKQRYTIDPIKAARLKPNASNKLIITIEPDTLGKAALMVRTNHMAERERFFVFPDVDVHTKVLQMGEDTLWQQRNVLGIDSRFGQGDVKQVQMALQSLSATVPAATRSLSHGRQRDRYVVTDKMPYQAWALDLGGADRQNAARFRPLASHEVAQVNANAQRLDEQVGQGFRDFFEDIGEGVSTFFVETVPKTATTVANETADFVVDDVGGALEDAGEAVVTFGKQAVKEVEKTAVLVWDETSGWVEQAVEDTGEFIEETTATIGQGIKQAAKETGEFFTDVAEGVTEALEDAVETVVRVTVEVGGKLLQVVVDTIEKVGKVAQKVIEQLGILWHKFVDFLKDILGWNDILTVHDHIIAQVNQGIDLAQRSLEMLKDQIRGWIDELQGGMIEGIDGMIEHLGGSEIANVTRDGGLDTSEISDKIDWFVSLIIDDDDLDTNPAGSQNTAADGSSTNPLMNKITGMVPQTVKDQLEQLLTAFADLLKDHIENDLPIVIDGFFDSMALFQAALDQPDRAKELVLSAVLSLSKSLLVTGLSIVDTAISMLFEIAIVAIELLQAALNAPLEIPILSGLYSALTEGRDLTGLSLFALITAVPTTLMGKVILGRTPFQNTALIGQSLSDGERALRESKQDWALVYGSMHMILLATDLIYDIQGATNKETSPQGQQVELRRQPSIPIRRSRYHRGRVLYRRQPPTQVSTATPAVFSNVNPQSTIGKGMTILKLFPLAAGIAAQLAGNPIGHFKGRVTDLEGLKAGGNETPAYWSYYVWNFQWSYLCLGVLDFIAGAAGSFDGSSSKIVDYGLPALTTAVGITHMGLMSKLVHEDKQKEGGYTAVNGRRHGGWMFDTLPGLSKVLTYPELNQNTYYIPLIIHSTLFVTLGHLGEAIVYFVRAGQDIESPAFDL